MKLKKTLTALILACALALGLMPKLPASAREPMQPVPQTSYTLTIPSTLSVANSGWNDAGGISAKGSLASGKKLVVTASSGDEYALVSGENKVTYSLVAQDGGEATTAWTFDSLSSDTATTMPLGIDVADYSTMPAGEYTDTVTFTASVESAAFSVTVSLGSNTSNYLDITGGALTQEGLTGAMEPVTVSIKSRYADNTYFDLNDFTDGKLIVDGITAEYDSENKSMLISGTPTADVTIQLMLIRML